MTNDEKGVNKIMIIYTCDTGWMVFNAADWVNFTSKYLSIQHEIWLKKNLTNKKIIFFLTIILFLLCFLLKKFHYVIIETLILTSRISRQLASSFGNKMDCLLTAKLNKTTSNKTTK